MGTHIAILKSNGMHNLSHPSCCGFVWKNDSVVTTNYFSNFGVDRIVIYYRPEVERVAASLKKKLFPGAVSAPPRLPGRITVKVVLGHDLGPKNRPQPCRFMGRNSQGLSQPGPDPHTGFRQRPAHTGPGLCYNIIDKFV